MRMMVTLNLKLYSGMVYFSLSGYSLLAHYLKQRVRAISLASDDTQKFHRSRNHMHKSSGYSHKTLSRSFSCNSQLKGSISIPQGTMKVFNCVIVLQYYSATSQPLSVISSNYFSRPTLNFTNILLIVACWLFQIIWRNYFSKLTNVQNVDLSKLEMAALWRYWQHFNLMDAIPNPSKEQLIDVVKRHFTSQQLDELQVIVGFVQAAKRLKTLRK
ncbi:uncharacterized protein LOC132044215 isoform X2 [Lycium ferocissimum]|uniref:uncharacterized protein LOC132044215 isoform X2 n=1 Tax=Lycium ferocissimum TaxID=112874 RepID=UPI002815A399|nr:uncharacterized protein LOC132044215 isoform X2 [Lycium ferocissimum]